MAGGGYCRLPNGTVVVALTLTRPMDKAGPGVPGTHVTPSTTGVPGEPVRVLVHAANRARALTRLRNLGLRAVYLRGNDRPPTPDEITAVLHHPDGLLWRETHRTDQELWHSIRTLLRPAGYYAGPARPAA